jgi:hypothetical protein
MRRSAFLCFIAALLVAGSVFGQGTTGTVRVIVQAEDESFLPGATVIAESEEALGSRTAVSDDTGVATLTGLDPSAAYVVTASLPSFNTARFEQVLVKAGSTTTLRATLSLAAVKEEIIVVAESPLVDFSSAISGQDITLQLTESLPTGRSYQNYLQLVPGTAPTDPSIADENPAVRSGLNYADIGGVLGRSRDNFYFIEGIDVTDPYSGYFGANLNTEIIQEQSVMTGGIPAEYTGSPGLISSVITKAGGNEFHGSLNYFFQSDSLVAANDHADDADFSTYDTAFTIGGPIVQDQAWFFASYRLLNREENVSNLETGAFMRTVTTESDQAFLKASWAVTPSIKLVATYLSDPEDQDGETDRDILNHRSQRQETGGKRYIGTYSQVIGDAYITAQFGKHEGEMSVYAVDQNPLNNIYFQIGDDFSLEDEQLGGRGTNLTDYRNNEFIKGKLEWYFGTGWGDHTVSFGAEWLDHINDFTATYPGSAQYGSFDLQYLGVNAYDVAHMTWSDRDWRYNNTSDFVGLINAINASPNRDMHYSILDANGDGTITQDEIAHTLIFNSTSGNPNGMINYYRITERLTGPTVLKTKGTTLYLQDSYQRNRLTINAGLRAEEWKHVASNGFNIYTFDYDIAPRIGAIYDLTGEGKMKLSAYYGRYYDPVRMNMTNFAGTISGRVRDEQLFVNGEWLTYRTRGYTDAAFAPTTKTPYTDDIQLSFEMELGNNMSFETILISRKTRDILEDYDLCLYAYCTDGSHYYPGDINAPGSLWLGLEYFGYDVNPGTNFVIGTLYGGKRDWDGVELVFRKRYSDNWQMLSSYTYADAMGNTNSDSNADFQGDVEWLDPRSPYQWARQPGMIEHIFKVAASYHWDNGIVAGGSYRWNSGTVASRTWAIYGRNLPMIVEDAYEWNGATTHWLEPNAVGSIENDSWGSLDLRVQYNRDFGFFDGEFFVDIFNALDDQAAVRNEDLVSGTGATDFGDPIQWVPPRRFYIGARLSF